MTTFQKAIRNLAAAFAIFLTICIAEGVFGLLGLFGGLWGGSAASDDTQPYAVSSDIRSLDMHVVAADFTIKQGVRFLVESNLKDLTVEEKNGMLSVQETKRFGLSCSGAVLTLYIPTDLVFETVNIETGAGKLTIEHLSADRIDLELGAGEVSIQSILAAASASIDGGAGKFTIAGGELHDLDLDMGAGQLNITAALTGDCSFDLGLGESNITVAGDRGDYRLSIEKGIGSVTVNGTGVSDQEEQGRENSIRIRGGIGAINLRFTGSHTY